MMRPRFHLIAPAGSCRTFLEQLGVGTIAGLVARVRASLGDNYDVSADEVLLLADEDEEHGGRQDDQRRAADIEGALADSSVAGIVALRGGAWFTRILPRIDFRVLDHRTMPVAVFGFSELTTLVNIVAAHRNGIGFHDLGPAFLGYGMRRFAAQRAKDGLYEGMSPKDWMLANLQAEFDRFFRRCISRLEGRESIALHARLDRGSLPEQFTATFVGGNLTVLSTLVGSRFEQAIAPEGRWLMIEDYNDKPERFDRFLSHFTLAGYWERCAGVLLGDFHHQMRDLRTTMLEMLEYHLPKQSPLPILATREVGHVWPMTPLPLHQAAAVTRTGEGDYELLWPPRSTSPIASRD